MGSGRAVFSGITKAAVIGGFLAVFAFFGAVLVFTPAAWAQGSPGPMSRGHKNLKTFPVDCNKCHEAGFGVPDEKCLSCHTHQPLRARIRAGKGFHAAAEVKKKKCKDCHAEHVEEPPGSGRGRKTTVDWRPFGGKRNFNHRLTGWPLEGTHRYQKCETCHNKKYPKTKLTTYLGLREECTTCHFGTKKKKGVGGENPHEFTDVKLTDCTVCHNFSNFRVANLGATKFDHNNETNYPLVGNHKRNKCVDCHKNIKDFEIEESFTDCKGCHEDSHKSVISAKRSCKSCHNPKVKFRKTSFDHGKETKFALNGQHARNRCKDCHKIGSKPVAPEMACITCHEDIHKGRFGKETCEGCHVDRGFKIITYNHNKKTKFELTGKHETTKCVNCHRFGIGLKFEKFETNDCASCHQHEAAHCGQFGQENCERCHVRGGDRTSKFDHSLTRFPLERAHETVDCERCHKPAHLGNSAECRKAVKYTGQEPQCFACHVDIHGGELGQDCGKCHTGGANFKTLVFDHNRDARFDLTGFHQTVDCYSCHPGRAFKMERVQCYDCHKEDDVHVEVLGDDCAKCHETTGGAPKFDHNLHTRFEREGVHNRIECERCHFLNPEGGSYVEEIQALKAQIETSSASPTDPGQLAAVQTRLSVLPAMAPAGAPLDLKFRAAGVDCADCHPDPHQVRANLDCAQCHGYETWVAPPRNGYHESAGFSLNGAHSVVACTLCHTGAGSQAGLGERCGNCHVQDDVHAQSLGTDCGRCHEQLGWMPTTFTHIDTGYVLEGIHRTLECRQCHQSGNYLVGRNCYNCHLEDLRQSDSHSGQDYVVDNKRYINWGLLEVENNVPIAATADCSFCHNQYSFYLGTIQQIVPPGGGR